MTAPSDSVASRRPRLRKGEGRQLRDEILAATDRMLLETGSQEAVSIRALADAVGVTPPSIYRHFADKNTLIFEVCARHFTALEDHLRDACAGIDDPVARLAAMGRAYISFGVANPEPYRIMFMTRPDLAPVPYQGEMLGQSAAFGLLLECVQSCIDAGRIRDPNADALRLAIGFWARVHGLTSLLVSKPELPASGDPGFIDDYTAGCLWGVVTDDR